MLLAVAHRVLRGPEDVAAWTRAWKAGRFDAAAVTAYLKKWRGRFDLFDTERPFYQAPAALPLAEKGPDKAPVRRLVFETCDFGAASHLFAQRGTLATTLPIAAAARGLVAFQGFAQGGLTMGGSDAAAPLVLPGVVLVTGANLFETLLLNAIPGAVKPADRPAWEDDEGPVSGRTRAALGRLDLLTWQSRSLGLHREGDAIDGFAYVPGERIALPERDPMGAWKERKGVWYPVGIDPNRVLWRDAHALLQHSDSTSRPAACDHLAAVADVVGPARPIALAMLGMRWDQKRILIARHERLPIAPALLRDEWCSDAVRRAVERAEEISGDLRAAAWAWACQALGSADKKTIAKTTDSLDEGSRYWAALTLPFERLLLEIGDGDTESGRRFERSARLAAQDALYESTRARAWSAPRALRAGAIAERVLRARLASKHEDKEESQ
jgi:CRISPR system Cascade subunit CasA